MKGLKGDGHGGWYDAKGNFKAKTVNGKLVFTGGGGAKPPEDPNSTKVATPQAPNNRKTKTQQLLHLKRLQLKNSHQRKVVSLQSQVILNNRLLKSWGNLHQRVQW